MRALVYTLLILLLLAPVAPAATDPGAFVGDWSGTLDAAGTRLRLVVHLSQTGGAWTGTMDSVDQGANGIPIDSVRVNVASLVLVLTRIGGRYEGQLIGDVIDGTWSQSGMSFPLDLKRGTAAITPPQRPQEPKPPFPYDAVEVTYPNPTAKITLAGTLTVPRGKGPFPAVVLITGSGAQDRDESVMSHKPFLVLADALTRAGIVVLRADDRGVGKSTGEFKTATSKDFAGDAQAGVAFLKTRGQVDRKRIGLVGHSEGGIIAPMVAAESKDVAYIVLMAAPASNIEYILREQSRLILEAAGLDSSYAAVNDAAIARACRILREEPRDTTLTSKLDAVADEMMWKASAEQLRAAGATREALTANVRNLDTPWMRFLLNYDPVPTLRRVRVPVLALNGELDLQVPPSELARVKAALEDGMNAHVDAVLYPNLNHLFQTATTGAPGEYFLIEETMSPLVLQKISRWILARKN